MKVLSIDQSMASCAYVVFEDEEIILRDIIKTTSSASPKEWQKQFTSLNQQMMHIADQLFEAAVSFKVDHMVMESLSLGSIGDQTRNLAGLYHVIQTTFIRRGFPEENIHTVAPTSVKSWARQYLPLEEQSDRVNSKGKPLLVKMKKEHMVKACEMLYPEVLVGYNASGKHGGKEDIADATLIGRMFIDGLRK